MRIESTLENYRCFEDTKPARIVLRDGFTALLGTNNSGKSTLLEFFYVQFAIDDEEIHTLSELGSGIAQFLWSSRTQLQSSRHIF